MRRAGGSGERESWGSARPHGGDDQRYAYSGHAGGAGGHSEGGGGGYGGREREQWAAPRRGRSRSRSPRREQQEQHARGFEGGRGANYREQQHGGAFEPAHREENRHAGGPRRPPADARGGRGTAARMVFDAPPNATLIFKNLSPGVDETMILRALESFSPIKASVIRDRETGKPRGFAFVEFPSVEHATSVMKGFEFIPLVFDERAVVMGYADRTIRRPQFNEGDRQPHIGAGHPPQHDGYQAGSQPTGPPRFFDWLCDQCNATNFSRRTECFKCFAPKPQSAREVPPDTRNKSFRNADDNYSGGGGSYADHGQTYDNSRGSSNIYNNDRHPQPLSRTDEVSPPSNVLVVRHIPLEVDEGELQVVFASLDGISDIRLVRDRATNESRGFAFVDFNDVDAARVALDSCQNLLIGGNYVRVSYAFDSFHPRPDNRVRGYQDRGEPSAPRSAEANSLIATALEQAQWALANGYRRGGDVEIESAGAQEINLEDDVNSLLASAAESAKPHIEEPKKQWPPPFETAGGSYVYASDVGLYWDPNSMFYYSPASKLYYSTFLGKYYRCNVGSGDGEFKEVSPPLPIDNTAFESHASTRETDAPQKPEAGNSKGISLSLKLPMKKKVQLSFGTKISSATASKKTKTDTVGSNSTPFAPAVPIVGAMPSAGMMRKSANDIAKWSQVQKKTKSEEHGGGSGTTTTQANVDSAVKIPITAATPAPTASVIDSIVNTTTVEAPICLLCRRKFASMEVLRKHETMSKLHLDNLAKAREAKQAVALEQRDRERTAAAAHEKREREAANQEIEAKRQRLEAAAKPAQDVSVSLEEGIGGKMLKMMGWKSGEGLGKRGTGITAPISASGSGAGIGASGTSATAGLGSKAGVAVEISETATFKERVQSVARARYDAMQ